MKHLSFAVYQFINYDIIKAAIIALQYVDVN